MIHISLYCGYTSSTSSSCPHCISFLSLALLSSSFLFLFFFLLTSPFLSFFGFRSSYFHCREVFKISFRSPPPPTQSWHVIGGCRLLVAYPHTSHLVFYFFVLWMYLHYRETIYNFPLTPLLHVCMWFVHMYIGVYICVNSVYVCVYYTSTCIHVYVYVREDGGAIFWYEIKDCKFISHTHFNVCCVYGKIQSQTVIFDHNTYVQSRIDPLLLTA
jgi:hypothetical protein